MYVLKKCSNEINIDKLQIIFELKLLNKQVIFFRVFTTVIKSLGEYFTPVRGSLITWEYVVEVSHK